MAALNDLLAPIQADFQSSPEWQEIEKKAYPPPPAPEKKKKEKKLGTKYSGGDKANVKTKPDGSVEGKGKEEVALGKGVEAAMENLQVDGKAS
jgi:tyrosyl-tRNA synthetase